MSRHAFIPLDWEQREDVGDEKALLHRPAGLPRVEHVCATWEDSPQGPVGGGVSRRRATSLSPPDIFLLAGWGESLSAAFDGGRPYLVGSVARAEPDWRDVDVRLILPDDDFAALTGGKPERLRTLNAALSLWGRQVTGLPIDFQLQDMTTANAEHDGPRHRIGRSR